MEVDFVGKIWKHIAYHMLQYVFRNIDHCPAITKDHFFDLALSVWKDVVSDQKDEDVVKHYQGIFAALT